MTMKRVNRVFGIAFMLLAGPTPLTTGEEAFKPHPRSSDIMHAPHEVEHAPPEPQRPQAPPRPTLSTVPLGYEGNEHQDGIHHGYDGHHNWHLKGGRH